MLQVTAAKAVKLYPKLCNCCGCHVCKATGKPVFGKLNFVCCRVWLTGPTGKVLTLTYSSKGQGLASFTVAGPALGNSSRRGSKPGQLAPMGAASFAKWAKQKCGGSSKLLQAITAAIAAEMAG